MSGDATSSTSSDAILPASLSGIALPNPLNSAVTDSNNPSQQPVLAPLDCVPLPTLPTPPSSARPSSILFHTPPILFPKVSMDSLTYDFINGTNVKAGLNVIQDQCASSTEISLKETSSNTSPVLQEKSELEVDAVEDLAANADITAANTVSSDPAIPQSTEDEIRALIDASFQDIDSNPGPSLAQTILELHSPELPAKELEETSAPSQLTRSNAIPEGISELILDPKNTVKPLGEPELAPPDTALPQTAEDLQTATTDLESKMNLLSIPDDAIPAVDDEKTPTTQNVSVIRSNSLAVPSSREADEDDNDGDTPIRIHSREASQIISIGAPVSSANSSLIPLPPKSARRVSYSSKSSLSISSDDILPNEAAEAQDKRVSMPPPLRSKSAKRQSATLLQGFSELSETVALSTNVETAGSNQGGMAQSVSNATITTAMLPDQLTIPALGHSISFTNIPSTLNSSSSSLSQYTELPSIQTARIVSLAEDNVDTPIVQQRPTMEPQTESGSVLKSTFSSVSELSAITNSQSTSDVPQHEEIEPTEVKNQIETPGLHATQSSIDIKAVTPEPTYEGPEEQFLTPMNETFGYAPSETSSVDDYVDAASLRTESRASVLTLPPLFKAPTSGSGMESDTSTTSKLDAKSRARAFIEDLKRAKSNSGHGDESSSSVHSREEHPERVHSSLEGPPVSLHGHSDNTEVLYTFPHSSTTLDHSSSQNTLGRSQSQRHNGSTASSLKSSASIHEVLDSRSRGLVSPSILQLTLVPPSAAASQSLFPGSASSHSFSGFGSNQSNSRYVPSRVRKRAPPECLKFRDIKAAQSSNERSMLYSRKLKELYREDSGLLGWIELVKSSPNLRTRKSNRGLDEDFLPELRSRGNHPQDDFSTATFPYRGDGFRARELSQGGTFTPKDLTPPVAFPGVLHLARNGKSTASTAFARTAKTTNSLLSLARKGSKKGYPSITTSFKGPLLNDPSLSSPMTGPSPTNSISSRTMGPRSMPISSPSPVLSHSSLGFNSRTSLDVYGSYPNTAGSVRNVSTGSIGGSVSGHSMIGGYKITPEALELMSDILPDARHEHLVECFVKTGNESAAISLYLSEYNS